MNRRLPHLAATLLLNVILTSLLTSCAGLPATRDPRTVTVAVVEADPLTDDGAVNEQSIYSGVKLAADLLRRSGGARIQIDLYDDENDPVRAAQIAEQIARSEAVAVIGHSSVESLQAAADGYEAAGIPTLNVSPITEDFTQSYYYHFNTSYTAETEAAYIANYIRKIDNAATATVLSTPDGYSQTVAKKFRNTFQGLGGVVTIEEVITPGDSLEQIVSDIISANTETSNPGTIFIATDEVTAAELVILMKRKGVSYPITGSSNLNSPVFLELIESQPEEVSFPGYYTDGILTTSSVIFDSANRHANQFLVDYQTTYSDPTHAVLHPGDDVIHGYDAAAALLTIIQGSNVNGSELQVQADRERIYNTLVGLDNSSEGISGILGPLFFEPSQNTPRAPRFGVYQSGEFISANVQFEPIESPNEIQDLDAQVEKGRVMTVNGGYVYKANVVYAGIDLIEIDDIDIKTSTYRMDFYLWFRYRPNEQDDQFQPEDFLFTNSVDEVDIAPIREETNSDGTRLTTYRVNGTFKHQFQFHDYPFDRQRLIVEFRSQSAATSLIQYVVDRVGMRYDSDRQLLENYRSDGAFDSLFGWRPENALMAQAIFPTTSTLGSPSNFDRRVATNYSLIHLGVDLQRDSLQFIVKSLLPLLITLILAYITFFLPLGHEERLTIGSTALLSTAFFHLTFSDSLPEVGYTVAMEFVYYAAYGMSALIVLLETLSIRYEKITESAKRKSERLKYEKYRHDLDMLGRIAYPTILLSVLLAGFLVYNGTIQLSGGEDVERTGLFEEIVASSNVAAVSEIAAPSPVSEGDVILLSLSTWRPEDTERIQSLIEEFEAYALETTGKTIVVDYRPVMSVNYDSILEQQLNRGEGPDLLYVRPFSTEGNIIRYLTPLNDLLPLENSFDGTKLIPWTNTGSGLYYAVPFVGVVQGVYYNKDIFDKYFLEAPVTWEEFKSTAAALKFADEELIPIANALNRNEDSEMFMSIAANFLGGPEGRERFMRTDGTGLCYDNSRVVLAFRAVEDIKPYLPPNAAFMNSQASKELFLNGEAAMLFGGSWDLQLISAEAKFNWDVFAVPAPFFGTTYVIFQPDIGIGMNNASAHPEEAQLFLEWLTTREAVNLVAQYLPGFYPLSQIEVTRGSNPDDVKFLDLVNSHPADIRWMYTEISSKSPSALEIIREDLYRMLAFDLTPEDAAQHLQDGLGEWYEPAQSCTN